MSPARKKNMKLLQGVTFGAQADYQTWIFAVAGLSLMFVAAHSLVTVVEEHVEELRVEERRVEERPMPNFASISDVQARKTTFFRHLAPYVEEANSRVLQDRASILKLEQYFDSHGGLSSGRLEELNAFLEEYGLDRVDAARKDLFHRLLMRADTIPASLALAQAALESGWGTSRFARQGNNLFGIWCYEPGCGLVPKRRPPGRSYEVAAYPNPADSFSAYFRNLNSSVHYQDLREIRYQHRVKGAEPTGYDLAEGLVRYSQERWTYVDKVRNLIVQNRLERI